MDYYINYWQSIICAFVTKAWYKFDINNVFTKLLNMRRKVNGTVYHQLSKLAKLTITTILSGKRKRSQKFLQVAEALFINGDNQMKRAMANVYVYQVSTLLLLHHLNPNTFFPVHMQREYHKQCNAC